MTSPQYVSASELAEYIYCECCWIDKLEGLQQQTLAMEKGSKEHEHIQARFFQISFIKRLALLLILTGIIFLVGALLIQFVLNTRL